MKHNKYLYKIRFLLISICILASLIGCQKMDEDEEKEIQIGVVVYDEYDTFLSGLMESFMNGVSEESKNGRRITVKRYSANGSQITENEQVEEMIEKGCNVICVNLVDRTDPTMIIECARKADVPVIFFNRELVEKDLQSWNKLYYVGADALESGIMQGEIAANIWQSDSSYDRNGDHMLQYVVLEGEAGHQDSIVRSEYSVQTLVDQGITVDKCESSIANWKRGQAQTKMGQLIHKYGESIELVLCNNDDMALGAIDEYVAQQISKEKRPIIVGIDGTSVGLQAVIDGDLQGTVYNDKEGQADAMLHLAIAAVTGKNFDQLPYFDGKYIRFPYVRITENNIHDYIIEE
ncbi:MAG: galactose ABC transporter substrate-binding protein [Eubacteriales bacterium]|nr:galactose ABC transporter substrate-binding protein [Eubacteriales bacterium]